MNINLTLPRTWNQCSVAQLELIADVLREQVERQDRYHPFSMQNVKIAIFFALSGIEILEGPNPRVPVEEQYYTCRLTRHRSRSVRFGKKHFPFSLSFGEGRGGTTFSLYLWQINYWLNGSPLDKNGNLLPLPNNGRGQRGGSGGAILDWLNNDNGQYLTTFPYPTIRRRHRSQWFSIGRRVSFQGPVTDLDGFSWSQYRLATEAMQNYVTLSNNLLKMQQMNAGNHSLPHREGWGGSFSDDQLRQQAQSVDMAKSLFLATIFNRKVKHVETATGMIRKDYHYESNQITDNAEYFRNFPDTQWQVILFWWTGIMHQLSKRYPHVFKVQKTPSLRGKAGVGPSALDIYTATIATMQKYVGINEKECNNQSYSLVLEQLERMSKENEELEKIRHKK